MSRTGYLLPELLSQSVCHACRRVNLTAALIELEECEDHGDCLVAPKGPAFVGDELLSLHGSNFCPREPINANQLCGATL